METARQKVSDINLWRVIVHTEYRQNAWYASYRSQLNWEGKKTVWNNVLGQIKVEYRLSTDWVQTVFRAEALGLTPCP